MISLDEAEEEYVKAAYDRHARKKCWNKNCAFCQCEEEERKRVIDEIRKLLKRKVK